MKKLFVMFLAILTVLALVSCANEKKNDNHRTTEEDAPEYFGNDFEEFLDSYVQAQLEQQAGEVDLNATGRDTASLTVPVLQSDDFVFRAVQVNEYNYLYYYDLIGTEGSYFDYETGICVAVSKSEISFAAVMEQYNLTPVDGKAFNAKYNEWILNDGGKRISIDFPDDLIVETAEELNNYFTFEKIVSTTSDDSLVTE